MAPKTWQTEGGDEYLAQYDASAEGADKEFTSAFGPGSTFSTIMAAALEALHLHTSTAKILEIGCNAGSKLSALKALGCLESNLYGIDLSPQAVAKARGNLPSANVICVPEADPFDYSFDGVFFDLAFCCATLAHVPEESRTSFFAKPSLLGARHFGFIEGISHGPTRHEWGGWVFRHDDWLQVAGESPALGEIVYQRRLDYVGQEAKEMFHPSTHDMLCIYKVIPPAN
mmetsp:Transcript_28257/g.79777  ORF Transcript_28257/g.79777 Transcript_28257/m.79777 type:complete len:229 (-) Transcript_28257:410-1096(-)|eukprot:CAMPEP_0117673538 /NCGR_PEP_ID=MMETSP0804-20121206/14529_1 /TAXON_ID=1074897 /ORGANISM="Tetraselmis astigmatica, Strain CCMP880" /LENGTH=228 /DNA_ID=CAMNT_0005482289 /DNA_START=12 /DNA_END=698 /DNA_ORIENTATION=+